MMIVMVIPVSYTHLDVYKRQLLDNHKAYIQSWIEILKNDPKILFQAIKDAEKISDYIQEQAPIARE